ncbi:PrsW family intramembrane metalloprotease [Streptomyces sp. NPDC050560]|uniref:PrsW family intramembrane metalloprotease n=1 Tax=Streptomyces sp. NPDC050560 TaxID=3365630 RepID=UPI0037BA4381
MAASPSVPARSPRYAGIRAPRPRGRGRAVRLGVVAGVLALCGLLVLGMVRQRTGTGGFLVGLGLAALPVGPLVAVFGRLGGPARPPWRLLMFALAWGGCAAALIAMAANSFAARAVAAVGSSGVVGTALVAPVVEECAKAGALVLLLVFRRRALGGVLGGAVVAGVTATGFAFTENVLYLGDAFGNDRLTGERWLHSLTLATFLVRIGMGLFAHPLFTVVTALGLGAAARPAARRARGRVRAARLLAPAGLLAAVGLHALWNGSPRLGGFPLVYGAAMVPVFLGTAGCCLWLRRRCVARTWTPHDERHAQPPPAGTDTGTGTGTGTSTTGAETGTGTRTGGTGGALRGGRVEGGGLVGGEGHFHAREQRRQLGE